MGNTKSSPTSNVEEKPKGIFHKELSGINQIVNAVVDSQGFFKNNDYNFLSESVCNQHYILLHEELNKHLKVDLKMLGTSLYLIPKKDEAKLQRYNLTKAELCQTITNYYIKILYTLCAIKSVYNLENHGQFSIAGIVFSNIHVIDGGLLQINYCKDQHKYNYRDNRIDLGKHLEGIQFLSDFIMDDQEMKRFMTMLRSVFNRNMTKLESQLCQFRKLNEMSQFEYDEIVKIIPNKTIKSCHQVPQHIEGGGPRYNNRRISKLHSEISSLSEMSPMSMSYKSPKSRNTNHDVVIGKHNPVFKKGMCHESDYVAIKTNSKEGKEAMNLYIKMRKNFENNISKIKGVVDNLVEYNNKQGFILRDIEKPVLDNIINTFKVNVQIFYLQSLIDYHYLLDFVKNMPTSNRIIGSPSV
jgi:hypothetical protein